MLDLRQRRQRLIGQKQLEQEVYTKSAKLAKLDERDAPWPFPSDDDYNSNPFAKAAVYVTLRFG